jgi:F-type H+-transporting ATPase subunit gamma
MGSLKDIRNRIDSVENTKQITQAMKMVATAKLQRAEERVEEARPYAQELRRVIASLIERADEETHPLLEQRELRNNVLVIVVSTDRGLCGSFNANLFRNIRDFIQTLAVGNEEVDVATIGDKADLHFGRQENREVVHTYDDVIENVSYDKAREIAGDAREVFLDETYDAVYIAYNEFISAIQYEQVIEPLLPLSLEDLLTVELGTEREETPSVEEVREEQDIPEYKYEPDEETLLEYALPRHLETQVLQALLESAAAEQGARMTAMDNATENAEEMIEELTLEYNRARQAAITTEIMEIVSGAEAMKEE